MPLPLAAKIPVALRGRLGLALAALGGTALAFAISAYLRAEETRRIHQEIERRVSLRHDFLHKSLREYDSALYALRLLVEHSDRLTPAEFEAAAAETLGRVSGIQALQWAPRLPHAELPAFVARVRELVDPRFAPGQRLPDGTRAPLPLGPGEASRPEHALVAYVHPREGNEAALGYDLFTAPTAPDLQRAAAQPGTIVLSRAFPLIQGGEGVVLATYVARAPSAEEPAPLAGPGFVQVVLRLDGVLERVWSFTEKTVIDVMVVDVTEEPVHLFTQVGDERRPATLAAPPPGFVTPQTQIRELSLGGRVWRAHYRPRPEWIASRRSQAPLLSFLGTALLTLVSVAYLRTLQRRTERIRSEVAARTAELDESRALLNEIIDHSPSPIWVKDSALRFQLVNLSFAAHYALPREEILGRGDALLYPAETVRELEALDARILSGGETVSFENTYEIRGRRRTFFVSKFPLRRPGGAIYAVAGIATEITDLREAEAGRRAIERKLLEAQKLESLGILAGGVAHDFNNLLTGILGHANLARAQLSPDSPVQSCLAQIETASLRAAELCRQMLAYSGRGRLAVQPVDLGEVVRDTAGLLKLSLARRARLRFDLAPDLPLVVADLVQIRQIAMNLVLNASESLVDGEGDITVSTRLVHADAALLAACVFSPEIPPGDYACLEVSDTGCGMPPETLARIFDPFFSTKFAGRGLGLAAVLGIVRGHSGALQVESRPGQGTTFRLYLPVAPAGEARPAGAGAAASAAAPSGPASAPLRLLLVDDEAAVRETTAPLLASCGHAVDCFPDGETGLARFLASPDAYDAAILDLTMPGLGGADLLRRIREVRPVFPALLISGYTERELAAAELLACPRVAFLAKPFTLADLRAKLAAITAP